MSNLPKNLYHASNFESTTLRPSFEITGELVEWDGTESNKYLYASTDKDEAIKMALASYLEREYGVDRFITEGKQIVIHSIVKLKTTDILKAVIWIYSIDVNKDDGWFKNNNGWNKMTTEYKTMKNISRFKYVEKIDTVKYFKDYDFIFRLTPKSKQW